MGEEFGVKETKEVVTGAMKLGGLLYSRFKDGVQTEDITLIFAKIQGDPELTAALLAAYQDANMVPKEIGNLDVAEGLELGVHILQEGAKLVYALKS